MNTPPRSPVDPLAWLALVLSLPPILLLLLLAVGTGSDLLERLTRPDDLKATLYSADAGRTFALVLLVPAAGAVALGAAALRRRRHAPSTSNSRVAGAAIVVGAIALPVALVLSLVGAFLGPR